MFTKGVNRISQPGGGGLRNNGVAHQIDIVVGPVGIFRRQCVRRQAGGFHLYRQQFAQSTRHSKHFQFAFRRQSIAGFDLHAGHAFRQQRAQSEQSLFQ
ncbi:N-formimino-L-glutamate deiminase [compost metagenome]